MKKVNWFENYGGSNSRGFGRLRSAVFSGILLVVAFAPDLARGDSGNVSEPASDMRPVWLVKDT
jgi:hypothetical protein